MPSQRPHAAALLFKENVLNRHTIALLATSLALCESIFAEVWDYAQERGVPLGINVESVSIRKAEIEASLELMRRLQHRIETNRRRS